MGRAIGFRAVLVTASILATGSAWGQAPQQRTQRLEWRRDAPLVIKAVEEWKTIPREQADLPHVEVSEVIAGVRSWLKSFEGLTSWEARYATTFIQSSPSHFRAETRFRTISDGPKWYSWQQSISSGGEKAQPWEAACDGNTVHIVWPDEKCAQIDSVGNNIGWGSAPTLRAFLPQIPGDSALRGRGDLPRHPFDYLDGPEIRLLPVCTRVNERACYILERTRKEEYPIFRTQQEADQWDEEHEAELASRDRSMPRTVVIDPTAKAEDKISHAITTRLAVDPKLGFAVVRWAFGTEGHRPGLEMAIFPSQEITYQDFHKVDEGVQMPFQVEFTVYRTNSDQRREVSQRSRLVLESFVSHPECEASAFAPVLPQGYAVADTVRGIAYTVGDPQSKIDRLLAGAQARDAFYAHLRGGPAPALRGSAWINSDPIDLAGYEGRPIILHFWSIACGPCMSALPRLQAQYGDTLRSTDRPLFVSVHPHAEGADLENVRQIVKNKGVTFPVMVDAPAGNRMFGGDTFYRYRIFAVPSEIHIDSDGRVGEVGKELISESDWWVRPKQDR
ncbi:MAG: TlpA disulfide reductase family protein [Sedimentisphaerales bacterium]|nr:TlpA disulfide reductase family protein [Sedimentisphaerales bacterium]